MTAPSPARAADLTADLRRVAEAARARGWIRPPGGAPSAAPATVATPDLAKFDGVSVTFEVVTPDLARTWLTTNAANRHLRSHTVEAYARDMAAGDWVTNHQGIAFGASGTLLDGQHRLEAVALSGVPIILMVSRGWPEKPPKAARVRTMDTVDVGAGRSLSDLLRLQHGTENPRVVTSAARIIAAVCMDGSASPLRSRMTMSSLLAIASLFPEGLAFVANEAPTEHGLRRADVVGAVAMAYVRKPKKIEEFLKRLGTGENLSPGNPILPLRNYLLGKDVKREGRNLAVATAVATHLRAFVDGTALDRIDRQPSAMDWLRASVPGAQEKIQTLFKASWR